jgi:hypothetical protein
MTQDDETRIMGLAKKPKLHGSLANAMKQAQRFIHKIEKTTQIMQITGHIRQLPQVGIKTIELIVLPKFTKDLTGKMILDFQQTTFHHKLSEIVSNHIQFEYINPYQKHYKFTYKKYIWELYPILDKNHLAVTQLEHTGPAEFWYWLNQNEFRNGPLPWSWIIDGCVLLDPQRKIVKTKNEKELFNKIGYHYIPITHRHSGNPDIWKNFKLDK